MLRKILENTNIFLFLALALGLLYPGFSHMFEDVLIFLLIAMMTLSVSRLKITKKTFEKSVGGGFIGLAITYVLVPLIVIVPAFFLVKDPTLFYGLVIVAAMPPAIVTVAFTRVMDGNLNLAVVAEIIGYLASLVMAPLFTIFFIGESIDIGYLFGLLVLLIFAPVILSRVLPYILRRNDKALINPIYFLIIYTTVGLNVTLVDLYLVIPVSLILFFRTFVLGSLIYVVSKRFFGAKDAVVYGLFGGLKNMGAGIVVAMALLGPAAAVPATIAIVFEITYSIFLIRLHKT